jgi:tol-pal system protein YbgF
MSMTEGRGLVLTSGRRASLVLAAFVCATLAGCATTPPEQDPVVQKLSELDGRLLRIERVLANQSLLDLSQRIEAAQNETRALRGELDELQHAVEKNEAGQRELYNDVNTRLAAMEGAAVGAAATTSRSAGGLPVPQGDDRANYQAAFDLLKDAKYPEAISGFQQFLVTFPTSTLADNAQYWLGEAFYVQKDYTRALVEFRATIEQYPRGNKVPDALLKVGYCYQALGQTPKARAVLEQVVTLYPKSEPAVLAAKRLESL